MILLRILLLFLSESNKIQEIRPCKGVPDCLVVVYKVEITEIR
jgi:hypothetical protein